jgi:hypothetical protein
MEKNSVKSAIAKMCVLETLAMVTMIGCTALGPMPATTAAASLPAGRPTFEVQAAGVPGYYLSSAVQKEAKGASISQAALLIEPDSIIHVPGLIVGGRYVSEPSKGGYPEPMLGYRTFVDADNRIAVSAIGFATHGSGSARGASYSATRGGAEGGIDLRATPESKWFELHVLGGASLTGLSAEGTYCVDAQSTYGVDCPDMMPKFQHATAGGFYPAATGGIAIDMGRHFNGEFHGGRVELLIGGGTMPRVTGGVQQSAQTFASAGLALSVGFGEARN